jgi:hypothetical protein
MGKLRESFSLSHKKEVWHGEIQNFFIFIGVIFEYFCISVNPSCASIINALFEKGETISKIKTKKATNEKDNGS